MQSKWLAINSGPCKNRIYGFRNTYHCKDITSIGTSSESISTAPPVAYISSDQLQEAIAKALAEERQATASREIQVLDKTKKFSRKDTEGNRGGRGGYDSYNSYNDGEV